MEARKRGALCVAAARPRTAPTGLGSASLQPAPAGMSRKMPTPSSHGAGSASLQPAPAGRRPAGSGGGAMCHNLLPFKLNGSCWSIPTLPNRGGGGSCMTCRAGSWRAAGPPCGEGEGEEREWSPEHILPRACTRYGPRYCGTLCGAKLGECRPASVHDGEYAFVDSLLDPPINAPINALSQPPINALVDIPVHLLKDLVPHLV